MKQILKGKHFLANRLAKFRVPLFQGGKQTAAERLVDRVKQVGSRSDSAGLRQGASLFNAHFGIKHLNDFFSDFHWSRSERSQALDYLVSLFRPQQSQELGRLVGSQVAND